MAQHHSTCLTSACYSQKYWDDADYGPLHTARFKLTSFRECSFSRAAPSTQNSLPDSLKNTVLSVSSSETVENLSSLNLLNTSTFTGGKDGTVYNDTDFTDVKTQYVQVYMCLQVIHNRGIYVYNKKLSYR